MSTFVSLKLKNIKVLILRHDLFFAEISLFISVHVQHSL